MTIRVRVVARLKPWLDPLVPARQVVVPLPFLVALAACGLSGGQSQERVVGRVALGTELSEIVLPQSASVRVPFPVSVNTFGGGCVPEPAADEIAVNGSVAEVTLYDWRRPAKPDACTDDLRILTHAFQLQFDQPGLATVRVRGTNEDNRFSNKPASVAIDRQIQVQ